MKLTKFGLLLLPATLFSMSVSATLGTARAEAQLYNPPVIGREEVSATLTTADIPTGFGGFAKDYVITLEAGDQITIDVISGDFDTLVTLMDANGATVSENDDGPDGSTNSLLFARISEAGKYTVRVRSYAGEGTGAFTVKVARLRPI